VVSNQFESEAQQRWPDTFAQSQARMGKLSPTQRGQLIEDGNQITRELASLLNSKVAAEAPEVQEQIDRHYKWVCNFWTPAHDSYIALGQMYLDDERFTAHYDEFAPALASFIRDAILRYASLNLV
jgi:hypothetical protein